MAKTYKQSVHFRLVIEGDYSCDSIEEEELCQVPEDLHDSVLDYISSYNNLMEYLYHANITLTNLQTFEENP